MWQLCRRLHSCLLNFVFDISSRECAKVVSRRVWLHPHHPKIGPLELLLDTRGCGERVDWYRLRHDTGRLTDDCLPGSVINKFIPVTGCYTTVVKTVQIHIVYWIHGI